MPDEKNPVCPLTTTICIDPEQNNKESKD